MADRNGQKYPPAAGGVAGPDVDVRRLLQYLREARAEEALAGLYARGMRNGREAGEMRLAARRELRRLAAEGYLESWSQPTRSGRAETFYRPGRRWNELSDHLKRAKAT